MHTPKEIRLYIDPYLELLDRNEMSLFERCMSLVDLHSDTLRSFHDDFDSLSYFHKMDRLHDLYLKASDPHNADRAKY